MTYRIIYILWIAPEIHGKSIDATPQTIPLLFGVSDIEKTIRFGIDKVKLLLVANFQCIAHSVPLTAHDNGW